MWANDFFPTKTFQLFFSDLREAIFVPTYEFLAHMTSSFLSVRPNIRVTRLAEFSPFRRWFTLGSFLKIAEEAPIFLRCLCISTKKMYYVCKFSKKWVALHFGQRLKKTHLVTLRPTFTLFCSLFPFVFLKSFSLFSKQFFRLLFRLSLSPSSHMHVEIVPNIS
jgi:hypothetical protein